MYTKHHHGIAKLYSLLRVTLCWKTDFHIPGVRPGTHESKAGLPITRQELANQWFPVEECKTISLHTETLSSLRTSSFANLIKDLSTPLHSGTIVYLGYRHSLCIGRHTLFSVRITKTCACWFKRWCAIARCLMLMMQACKVCMHVIKAYTLHAGALYLFHACMSPNASNFVIILLIVIYINLICISWS